MNNAWKRTVFVLVVTGCSGSNADSPPSFVNMDTVEAEDGGRFVPSFQDEFEGDAIDTTKWSVWDLHMDYWPEEAPWRRRWKAENAYLQDGALVLRTRKESEGYSTGAIRSGPDFDTLREHGGSEEAKFEQAFGRFEARMKFQTQPGHWTAFWLMAEGAYNVDGSGRDGTEIDIAERAWLDNTLGHALHWDGYGDEHQKAAKRASGMPLNDGGWHVVTLEWYPDEYVFYVDGVETWRTDAGGVSQAPAHIRLTDEIGHFGVGPNAFGGGPIEDAAQLPDFFYVDYVRVWAYEG